MFLLAFTLAGPPGPTWLDPDLVVEPLVSGGHSRTQVAEAITAALPALRGCFADPNPRVPRTVRSLRADFTVDATGRAGGVKVEALPSENPVLEGCLQAVLLGLPYGAAPQRSQVQVSLVPVPPPAVDLDAQIEENAGVLGALREGAELDAVLESPDGMMSGVGGLIGVRTVSPPAASSSAPPTGAGGPPPAAGAGARVGGDPIILGALDKSLIDAVIKQNMGHISACYDDALRDRPDLAGKITIKFVIAKDGTVSSAVVKSTTAAHPGLERCLCEVFMPMQFPEPKGGGIVITSYPFIFSPG